jgi:uncharacterized protein YggE
MNEPFNGSLRVAAIGVLAILALFLLAETVSVASGFGRSGGPATDTITVQGDGQATVAPDVARISFSVQNTAATVADAQVATTKQANAAIDYVKGQGVSDKDVKTLSYDISPQYSYPSPNICPPGVLCKPYDSTPKITGYQVSETVQVTMRDLTKVGAMLSGLGKLEVQNVNGPDFALDDSTAGYSAARADAIDKAKAQARLLADQLGVHLEKIVNFSESSGGTAYPMMYAKDSAVMSAAAVAPTPSVPTGENTYNASVSITYEIR